MIVGLCGLAGAGKDAVAGVLVEERGYTRLAFADALKSIAEALDPYVYADVRLADVLDETGGWDNAKHSVPETRRFLQQLGVAVRQWDQSFWVKIVLAQVEPGSNYVITDLRFPDEVEAIDGAGGEIFRVERSGHTGIAGANGAHVTETALAGWVFPVIRNDGSLADLRRTVLELAA